MLSNYVNMCAVLKPLDEISVYDDQYWPTRAWLRLLFRLYLESNQDYDLWSNRYMKPCGSFPVFSRSFSIWADLLLQLKTLSSFNTLSNQKTSILNCFIKILLQSHKFDQNDRKSQLFNLMFVRLFYIEWLRPLLNCRISYN